MLNDKERMNTLNISASELKRATLHAIERDEVQETGDKVWFCIKPLVETSLVKSANSKLYFHVFTIPQSAITMIKGRAKKLGTNPKPYYERLIFDLISALDKSGYTWEVNFPDNDNYDYEKIKVIINWDIPKFVGYKEN